MTALKKEVESLVSGYFNWLKDETRLKTFDENDNFVSISTPHLDRHNDFLEIVVARSASGFELSDDGYVLGDLEASGCPINTPKRKTILNEVLNGFGVSLNHDVMTVHASSDNFAYRKHSLIQAMLAVNDMFFTASTHVTSFFFEDVRDWLLENDIYAIESANFTGKSGFNHKFDFTIPRSQRYSERYISTINNPSTQSAKNIIMAWEDTRPARPKSAKAYVLLNDQSDKPVPEKVANALREYDMTAVSWAGRQQVVEELRLN